MELKSSQSERQMKKIVTVNKEIKPLQPYINLKKQDELYVHLEEEKDIKVNRKFQYVSELLAHFDNLFKIRGYLEDFPNSYEFIIKAIKRYVLNYGKADINKL